MEKIIVIMKEMELTMNLYSRYIKRILDFFLALIAVIVLSPIIIILIIVGSIKLKGNPFFSQLRPGKDEKIFKLLKFRTMTNEKDKGGNFLPDNKRLTTYGKFLRKTSLDELPELFNIIKGDMAIVGPRPLLVEYLPWYTEVEKHRHDVRPGLTGLAQINGRNSLNWDERFALDIEYISQISFKLDIKIWILTIKEILKREDVAEDTNAIEGNFAEIRKNRVNQKK